MRKDVCLRKPVLWVWGKGMKVVVGSFGNEGSGEDAVYVCLVCTVKQAYKRGGWVVGGGVAIVLLER